MEKGEISCWRWCSSLAAVFKLIFRVRSLPAPYAHLSFRGVNEGEEVEEVNPPMAIYRNNVDAIRTLKRKKRRKVVKRSGQAWEVPEDTVEADAADLLYAGSENRSGKVVRQRPQSAKPKLSGSGGRPNQQQRKVRPQSAQSPSKKARPGSARPKSALPLHQAKNRKARPASARPL